MSIKFNEVTWYSKLLAFIFIFGVIPYLSFYIGRQYESLVNTPSEIVAPVVSVEKSVTSDIRSLSDAQFVAVIDKYAAKAEVIARGDINQDGFEDAIVQKMYCGASCSFDLDVVLNVNNQGVSLLSNANFGPAYNGSGAGKSLLTNIIIKNGIISLTGTGLACLTDIEEDPCTNEEWNVVKTVTYKFDGEKIVQLSVR